MQQQKTNIQQNRMRVNNQIRVPQVRVILEDGSSPGIMSTYEALKMAQELNLDLVEINPKASPPVVKIIDYGKYKYDEKKKAQEAKKTQKVSELKELTFKSNTEEHDLNHKLELAKQFLADGDKVKFTVKFRGREITHPELAKEKMDWIVSQLSTLITAVPQISMEGKFMYMVVNPK